MAQIRCHLTSVVLRSHCPAGTGSPVSLSSQTMHSSRVGLAGSVDLPKLLVVTVFTSYSDAQVPQEMGS